MSVNRALDQAAPGGVAGAQSGPIFSPAEVRSIISGLLLALFLASLDQTIVATALSSIARDLEGWQLMAWVVSSYLITSTIMTPIYGRLSDLYGRRLILTISIAIFLGASILCALSRTMPELIAARAIQGLGGGGLRSISQAVIADIIPPRDRGRYQGYFSSSFAVSNALGPILGGFMSEYLSWHWIFWINLPLGVAALALCSKHLAKLVPPRRHSVVDWVGAALILASTTLVLFGLDAAQRSGNWFSPETLGLVAAGLVLLLLLIRHEGHTHEPMLPLGLFRSSEFTLSCLILFVATGFSTAFIVLIPVGYQLVGGMSPNQAGLHLIPFTMGTVIGSFGAGQLVTRTGRYRAIPMVANLVGALLFAALTWLGLGRFPAFDIAATAALGASLGANFSPLTVAAQNTLRSQENGIGMATILFFRLMGGALGVAVLSTVLIAYIAAGASHAGAVANPGQTLLDLEAGRSSLSPAVAAALTASMRAAFRYVFLTAAVVMPFAVVASFFLKEVELRRGSDGSPAEG